MVPDVSKDHPIIWFHNPAHLFPQLQHCKILKAQILKLFRHIFFTFVQTKKKENVGAYLGPNDADDANHLQVCHDFVHLLQYLVSYDNCLHPQSPSLEEADQTVILHPC